MVAKVSSVTSVIEIFAEEVGWGNLKLELLFLVSLRKVSLSE